MTSSNGTENMIQLKTCRCGAGDGSFWTTRLNVNPDKHIDKCPICEVLKSGHLFISSKGLGWTSWKKRWFILTRKSLVFYRIDPTTLPQKGSEANLTLGSIDLNNSGSVEVRVEKKILTVLFPDGRDGRRFTLKAETLGELYKWKAALENALLHAPSPADAIGHNGNFMNDAVDSIVPSSSEQVSREKIPLRSTVVRQPILLALEDIDGSPSFLEKALRFIEQHGIKVEGILRQSADVEEVKRRIQEYEQGKVGFSPDEDAHVVGDCIKHVLRELPSSPVPVSCCTVLVQAYRIDRGNRVEAMQDAIYEHFPEPNRHLLQRILKMMQTVASHKSQNRMTLSALAACMAPLLLRPLLAGECDFDDKFSTDGDGSMQLRLAAAAANYAQAIVIVLLEEYDNIFDDYLLDDDTYSEPYSGSDGDFEDNESTDKDIPEPDGYRDAHNDHGADIDDGRGSISSDTLSKNSDAFRDPYNGKVKDYPEIKTSSIIDKDIGNSKSFSGPIGNHLLQDYVDNTSSLTSVTSFNGNASTPEKEAPQCENRKLIAFPSGESNESTEDFPSLTSQRLKSDRGYRRTSGRKILPMESIDLSSEAEVAVQRLKSTKADLQMKIAKEVEGNAVLQASLEKRKEALRERRLALEQDVERLREQLEKERDLRATLESGLMNMKPGNISLTSSMDSKTKKDLEEVALAERDILALKQKVADLRVQLNLQLQQSYISLCESCNECLDSNDQSSMKHQQEDVSSKTLSDQNNWFSTNPDSSRLPHESLVEKEQGLTSPDDTKPQPNRRASSASEKDTDISYSSSCSSSTSICSIKNEGIKLQGLVLPSVSSNKHLPKEAKTSPQSSMILPTVGSPPYLEPTIVKSNLISSTFPSEDENLVLAAKCSSMETHSRGSVSPSVVQPSQKQKSSLANKRSHRRGPSNEDPKADERASLSIKQPSEKITNTSIGTSKFQGTDNVSSSMESAMVDHNDASMKLRFKSEETDSSTSALTKLTTRLNILKERRVQIVNEIQNSETDRALQD